MLSTYSLSGQVLDDTGTPLSGVLISSDGGFTTTTGLDGSYLFPELLSGSYILTPTLDGYTFTPASRTVSLPPDAVDQDFVGELVIYSLSGQVLDDIGSPLAGVLVYTHDNLTATTGLDGSYIIEGAAPGTYTLTAGLDGYVFTPPPASSACRPMPSTRTLSVSCSPTRISAHVTAARAYPLQGVLISAGEGLTATTNSQGYYTLSGLLPGTYTLTASLDGYTFAPFSFVVSLPPDALDVDFIAVFDAILSWLPLVVK